MKNILTYINGKLVTPFSGSYLKNYNPSNGKVYSLIPDSEKQDVLNAVSAAKMRFLFGKIHQSKKDQIC